MIIFAFLQGNKVLKWIQSEKEAKEVVIWLSKSKHALIQAECFYSCNVIILFLLTGFCIQTNNILFVAMVVNYLNIVFASNKKAARQSFVGQLFVVYYLRMSAQRASILEMYFSTSLYSIELG